jgi:hypothetical protein
VEVDAESLGLVMLCDCGLAVLAALCVSLLAMKVGLDYWHTSLLPHSQRGHRRQSFFSAAFISSYTLHSSQGGFLSPLPGQETIVSHVLAFHEKMQNGKKKTFCTTHIFFFSLLFKLFIF